MPTQADLVTSKPESRSVAHQAYSISYPLYGKLSFELAAHSCRLKPTCCHARRAI